MSSHSWKNSNIIDRNQMNQNDTLIVLLTFCLPLFFLIVCVCNGVDRGGAGGGLRVYWRNLFCYTALQAALPWGSNRQICFTNNLDFKLFCYDYVYIYTIQQKYCNKSELVQIFFRTFILFIIDTIIELFWRDYFEYVVEREREWKIKTDRQRESQREGDTKRDKNGEREKRRIWKKKVKFQEMDKQINKRI